MLLELYYYTIFFYANVTDFTDTDRYKFFVDSLCIE